MGEKLKTNEETLVKVTGSLVKDGEILEELAKYATTVVHGAGKYINEELEEEEIPYSFEDGIRKTSEDAMLIVEEVAKEVNQELVKDLNEAGGGFAPEICAVKAEKVSEGNYTGSVKEVKDMNFENKVVSFLGESEDGYLNVNADHVAYAMAVDGDYDRVIYLTASGKNNGQKKALGENIEEFELQTEESFKISEKRYS